MTVPADRRRILEMNATQKLAHAAMKAQGLTTYYGLAQRLDMNHQRVARWVNGEVACDDDAAVRLADLAGIKPESALVAVAADRSKDPIARRLLELMAERLAA